MPISIAVCEDERNIREEIAGLIYNRGGEYCLDCYESGDALLKTGKQYDIYILDIQMPGTDGMELSKRIRRNSECPGPFIIFVTALKEHMQDAFDVQAYHFLLKPINEGKFHEVLDRAVKESLRRNRQKRVVVTIGGVSHAIALDDVLYAESSNRKVEIHTRSGVVEYYGKIRDFIGQIEENPAFFRCHRCYIVNMEHIVRYSANIIKMSDGSEIFLSRSKALDFINAYARYAMK